MEASNPLPPPPRPGSLDSQLKNNASLSNLDFRKMVLETPRRVQDKKEKNNYKSKPRRHEDAHKRIDTGEDEEEDVNNDVKEKKPHRKFKPPKSKTEEETANEDANQPVRYRDRAKERRENKNPDYEDTDLAETNLNLTSLSAVPPPGTTDMTTTNSHLLSIKNSKFLGGDVKHTHLVKGLDFALRDKVISELEKKQYDEVTETKSKQTESEKSVTHHTVLGKSVYSYLFGSKPVAKTNEMFLPGRTAYHFNLEDENVNEIPTTVYRSKADCPVYEETVSVSVDSAVLDRISKIISYLRLGKTGKTLKKKKKEKEKVLMQGLVPERKFSEEKNFEKEEIVQEKEAENNRARNPEDDIFQDAGIDYNPVADDKNIKEQKGDVHKSEKNKDETGFHVEDMDQSPEREKEPMNEKSDVPAIQSKYFGNDMSAIEDVKTVSLQYADNTQAEYNQNYVSQDYNLQTYQSSEAYVQNYSAPPPPESGYQNYPPPPPPPENFPYPDPSAQAYPYSGSEAQNYPPTYPQPGPALPDANAYAGSDWQTYLPGMENSTFYQADTVYTQQYYIPQTEGVTDQSLYGNVSNPVPPPGPNSTDYSSYANPQPYESQPAGSIPPQTYEAPTSVSGYQFTAAEEKDEPTSKDEKKYYGRREIDPREKDPTFISSSYAECYPDYENFSREVVASDDEDDFSKMDMGGKSKGRMHRWDFEDEEQWEKYNEKKEAMPRAAFQFGIKMVDGRKTRKTGKDRDQKLNNELQKINQILDRKKKEKVGVEAGEEDNHAVKRQRH